MIASTVVPVFCGVSAQKRLHGLSPNDQPVSQLLPDFPEKDEDAVNKRVLSGELTALVGARVMGEHRHPTLVE